MVRTRIKWIIFVVASIIIVTSFANSMAFRFTPTHSILKESYCARCHIQELTDIYNGTHIAAMPRDFQSRFFDDYLMNYYSDFQDTDKPYEQYLDSLCLSCHMNTLQFYRFEVSDPYIFNSFGNNNSVYGAIGFYNSTNVTGISNQVVTANLTLKSLNPPNASIEVTQSILLANFSYHQANATTFSGSSTLSRGDNLLVETSEVYPDYFFIILMLEGYGWNSSGFELELNGTSEDGSYLFSADGPGNYFLPADMSGEPYFHTSDYYLAKRLDMVYYDFRRGRVNNVSAMEGIVTSTRTGDTINGKTCSSQDMMCHIVQKITAMGSTIGFEGPDGREGFYRHDLQYTTSSGNCLLCHINGFQS